MNEYRNRDTGEILTERQFRASYDNVAFPAVLNQYVFNTYRIDPVLAYPQPTITEFQSVLRDGVKGDGKGNWFQAWKVVDWTQEQIDAYLADKAVKDREVIKAARTEAVANIKVDVNGKVFDGDEISQERMARAITISNLANITETQWVLADNTIATVTVQELKDALILAGKAQAELWPIQVGV
jgi:hypothetical protein